MKFPRGTPIFVVGLIVAVSCGLPVAWVVWQIAAHPRALLEVGGDRFRWMMVARTVGYNAAAACVAVMLAAPVALMLGRGRGLVPVAMWVLLPGSLLIPSIVYAYGWSQLVGLTGLRLEPGGAADVARCAWSLAAWLWPIPAGLIGLSLRRMDANLQQQALLDGALPRVTLRHSAPAIATSFAIVLVLAMQEFAVYEPTGVSVLSVEIRTVFDTGGTLASVGQLASTAPDAGGLRSAGFTGSDQAARAAAAVVTGAPLVLLVALLSAGALWGLTRAAGAEEIDLNVPAVVKPSWRVAIAALIVLVVVLGLPIASLILSHSTSRTLGFVIAEYRPQVVGTLLIAGVTTGVAGIVAFLGCVRPQRWLLLVAVAGFLVGGQFVAIALIRAYNRPWLMWAYNGVPVMVMAYLARFAWLALLAARGTASRAYRPLRDMAAVDGAGAWQVAVSVLWPVAWPALVASAVLVGVLSMGEVPATTLLSPLRPPMLVPSLMTWVHTMRSDPMIEASLLLAGMSLALGLVVAGLVWAGRRRRGWNIEDRGSSIEDGGSQTPMRRPSRQLPLSILYPLSSILALFSGCDRSPTPDAIWLTTGVGPAQVVYPRAIAYSANDDTFFLVDRMARVQHLDRAGQFLNDWVLPEQRYGKPVGISVGPDGNVYVPDTHYHRVIVYSPAGKELLRWGTEGTADGQFIWPTDVAFDAAGRVFVSEYGDHDRIQVFDHAGTFLFKFGTFGQSDGQFSRPQSMVIDGDTVYVTDACNHRIVVFKTDGTWLRNMGNVGSAPGEFRFPYGLDADARGHLVVTEFGNNRVQWIDKQTGRSVKTWGSPGREAGQLAYPWAATVDKRGRTVIVDAGNNRLQVVND